MLLSLLLLDVWNEGHERNEKRRMRKDKEVKTNEGE
jgi:hypothetical protein